MIFGPREAVWIAIVALAVYIVYLLIRFVALRKRPALPEFAEAPTRPAPLDAAVVPPPLSAPAVAPFMQELELQQLRRDVGQLRGEVEGLRTRLEELRLDSARQKESLESIQAERLVSPQYGEAIAFARRGLESDAIAERCGISVAEAELVRSLLQQGEGTNKGES